MLTMLFGFHKYDMPACTKHASAGYIC